MKTLYKAVVLAAMQAVAFLAHAADVEIMNKGDETTVTAVIQPPSERRGKPMNLWISAVHKGVSYFHNGTSWVPYTGGPLPVAVRGRALAASNKIVLAKGMDLKSLPGADLYIGYGETEEQMRSSEGNLKKMATAGKKYRWGPRAAP